MEVRGRRAGRRSHGRPGPRELATISSEGPARYIPLPAGGGGQPLIWPVQISCIVAPTADLALVTPNCSPQAQLLA